MPTVWWSFFPRNYIKSGLYKKFFRKRSNGIKIAKFINHVPMSLKMWHLVVTKDWHLWLMCQLSCSFQHFVFSCQRNQTNQDFYLYWLSMNLKFSQTDYFFKLTFWSKINFSVAWLWNYKKFKVTNIKLSPYCCHQQPLHVCVVWEFLRVLPR